MEHNSFIDKSPGVYIIITTEHFNQTGSTTTTSLSAQTGLCRGAP